MFLLVLLKTYMLMSTQIGLVCQHVIHLVLLHGKMILIELVSVIVIRLFKVIWQTIQLGHANSNVL